ncbi:hypothetical protein HOLleu_41930 [Holothuria leucospilota]|uniref:Ig-like domain-containing protein n=1 Tax=Holothuria leucospilota TaxID=206669 RepID=A0A9Q0YCE4_HOLLE|nr:hypothetical protein HOLleu_41930 [Holothuria leucospilota]
MYLNEGREILFRVQSNGVIFEGDTLQLACSYSYENETNVSLTINSKDYDAFVVGTHENDTYSETVVLILSIFGNDTFVCTAESDKHTKTKKLSIVVVPREFPYCSSNSSNEIIEGDRILLSCYAEEYIEWVTNMSTLITRDSSVSNKVRKEVVIQPFENETASVYTCVAPSSKSNNSECTVGPILVYKAIFLSIQPTSSDAFRLFPGRSRQFSCTSKPENTIIKWEMSYKDHNIHTEVRGQSIDVKILPESKFIGMINLTCAGYFGLHRASKSIILDISVVDNTTRIDILYFMFGGLTLLLVVIVFIVLVIGCRKFINLRSRVEIYDVKRRLGSSQSELQNNDPQSTVSKENGTGTDNHAFVIGNDLEYQEASRDGERRDMSKGQDDQSDMYAIIPEGQRTVLTGNVEQSSYTHGAESQLYTMTDRNNPVCFQFNDEKSWRGHRDMSVVYATPDGGRNVAEEEEEHVLDVERDAGIAKKKTDTPPYAIVNKRRLIIIPDDNIEEENFEDFYKNSSNA